VTAEVCHGGEVVVTRNHRNRAAPSGWMVRLVGLGLFDEVSGYAPCSVSLHRCNRLNRFTLIRE
jgi:hypothetical protein